MSDNEKIPLPPPTQDELKLALRTIVLGLLCYNNTFLEAAIFADGVLYKVKVTIALIVEE